MEKEMMMMMVMTTILKSKIILPNNIWSITALKHLQIVDIIIQSCPLLCHKYNRAVIQTIVHRNGNLKIYWNNIGNYKSRLALYHLKQQWQYTSTYYATLCGVLHVIFNSLSEIFLHIHFSVVGIVTTYRLDGKRDFTLLYSSQLPIQ
jgi:hypothetical protein